MTIAFFDLSFAGKAETVQVHLTLDGEHLGVQRNYHGLKDYR
jgi:hypothetical protein